MSLLILLLAGVCLMTGCGSFVSDHTVSENIVSENIVSENTVSENTVSEETASDVSEAVSSDFGNTSSDPLCLQTACPEAGYDNLYTVQTDALGSDSYSAMAEYGDKVLLIRENYHLPENGASDNSDSGQEASGSAEADSEVLDEDWDYGAEEPNLYYDFALYDPQSNTVTASFTTSKDIYSTYSVSGDRLFVSALDSGEFSVYDSDLQLLNSCEDADLFNRCGQPFYWDESANVYFSYDWSENRMLQIDPDTFSWEYSDVLPSRYPIAFSADSGCFLYSDVDKSTLRYRIYSTDAMTGDEKYTVPGSSYIGIINDNFYASEISGDVPLLLTGDFSGTCHYISCSNMQCMNVLEDGTLLLSRVAYDSVSGESTALFMHYDPSGEMLSSFLYDMGQTDGNDSELYQNTCIPLKGTDYVLLLVNPLDGPSRFMLWDIRSGKNDADVSLSSFASSEEAEAASLSGTTHSLASLQQVDSDGNPILAAETSEDDEELLTLIDDPDHYDWGDLQELHNKAAALGDRYGISILLGPEVPSYLGGYHIKQACDPEAVESALEHLEAILENYPRNFFSQLLYGDLTAIRIYLSGSLSGNESGMLTVPGGYVCQSQNQMLMVMDISFADSWNYMINHEFSHMIDRRLEFIELNVGALNHTVDGWDELNPEGFDYLYTYDNYEDNPAYDPDYFCDSYGTTFATEDRAEVFGNAMDQVASGYDWTGYFDEGSYIRVKMEYYCAWIREGFDTSGWPDTTAWEEVID